MKVFPFDRMVFTIAAGLGLAIAGLAYLGNQAGLGGDVKILSVSPPDGSSPAPTSPIRIEFGQAMSAASVQNQLVIQPQVQGQFHWTGNTLTFQPERPLLSQQVYTISLQAGVQTSQGQRTLRPYQWSFKPRPPSIVFLDGTKEAAQRRLREVSLGSNAPRELLVAPGTILDLAASPDGRQIAISVLRSDGKSEMWLVDPSTGNHTGTVDCGQGSCSNPIWSPDGKLLAYARNDPSPNHAAGPDRIWLYDLQSGLTQPVFQDNQVLGDHPTWSADSGSLAFVDQNAEGIHVVDLASRQVFFIQEGFFGSAGSLSVDGKTLAYTKIVPINGQFANQVWLAHLGADLTYTSLVKDPGPDNDNYPAWSPAGQWIAFLRRTPDQPHHNQVMLVQMSSGEMVQIAGLTDASDLKWNATGQFLLIQKLPQKEGDRAQLYSYDVTSDHLSLAADQAIQGAWLP